MLNVSEFTMANSKAATEKAVSDRAPPSNLTLGTDGMMLFSSTFFDVNLNRENQIVPGMLYILPKLKELNDWEQWQSKHWIELLQVQRLCELTLIRTFDNRDRRLNPLEDIKLINLYGRQRRHEGFPIISFEVVPRYTQVVELENINFRDPCFGRLFDFTQIQRPSDALLNQLLSRLRTMAQGIELSAWELGNSDSFKKIFDDCISCKPANQHPSGVAEAAGFRVALDREIQDERGKAICDTGTHGHVPALRYWQDSWMIDFSTMFKAWRNTVNILYPTQGVTRDFDLMYLMNSVRPPRHTYWRFIPRTHNARHYGQDIWGTPPNYLDIKNAAEADKITVEAMITRFGVCMAENLRKVGIDAQWPMSTLSAAPALTQATTVASAAIAAAATANSASSQPLTPLYDNVKTATGSHAIRNADAGVDSKKTGRFAVGGLN